MIFLFQDPINAAILIPIGTMKITDGAFTVLLAAPDPLKEKRGASHLMAVNDVPTVVRDWGRERLPLLLILEEP